jgi:hypothetical protein
MRWPILTITVENAKERGLIFGLIYTPTVNFINVKHANFSYKHCFGSFFSSYMYIVTELPKQCSYEKFVRLTLRKLTPRHNFFNVLLTAFMLVDPKRHL